MSLIKLYQIGQLSNDKVVYDYYIKDLTKKRCYVLDNDVAVGLIRSSLEHGLNLFDDVVHKISITHDMHNRALLNVFANENKVPFAQVEINCICCRNKNWTRDCYM